MKTERETPDAAEAARSSLAAGNIGFAEFCARNILETDPENAAALVVLAKIAVQTGLREWALRILPRARSALSQAEAENLLRQATDLPDVKAQPGSLLVIKAWRAGFWSEVRHVLGCLLLAEITGRTPITLWGSNSLYSDGTTPDAFLQYFDGVSRVTASELQHVGAVDFFPPKWTQNTFFQDEYQKYEGDGSRLAAFQFLGRKERVAVIDYHVAIADLTAWIPPGHPLHGLSVMEIYSYLMGTYLRPTRAVVQLVEDTEHSLGLEDVELSVHMRGSDKSSEVSNLSQFNDFYFEVMAKIYKGGRILLLTEDDRLILLFQQRFGDKVVVPDGERQCGGVPPHYQTGLDRVKIGMETIRDTYLAARTKKFIGNARSNLSCMVSLLMPPSSKRYLIGSNVLLERNGIKFKLESGA